MAVDASHRRIILRLPHQSHSAQPVQTSGSVVSTGRVQVVKETLSSQLLDLCGGLLPPRHYRPSSVETKRREAGENGAGAGDSPPGASSAGAAASSAGGGPQPPAAQSRLFQEPVIALAMRGHLSQAQCAARGHPGMWGRSEEAAVRDLWI